MNHEIAYKMSDSEVYILHKSLFAEVVETKYQRLGGLNNINVLSHSSKG